MQVPDIKKCFVTSQNNVSKSIFFFFCEIENLFNKKNLVDAW